jgi:hypothetical protein
MEDGPVGPVGQDALVAVVEEQEIDGDLARIHLRRMEAGIAGEVVLKPADATHTDVVETAASILTIQ